MSTQNKFRRRNYRSNFRASTVYHQHLFANECVVGKIGNSWYRASRDKTCCKYFRRFEIFTRGHGRGQVCSLLLCIIADTKIYYSVDMRTYSSISFQNNDAKLNESNTTIDCLSFRSSVPLLINVEQCSMSIEHTLVMREPVEWKKVNKWMPISHLIIAILSLVFSW